MALWLYLLIDPVRNGCFRRISSLPVRSGRRSFSERNNGRSASAAEPAFMPLNDSEGEIAIRAARAGEWWRSGCAPYGVARPTLWPRRGRLAASRRSRTIVADRALISDGDGCLDRVRTTDARERADGTRFG